MIVVRANGSEIEISGNTEDLRQIELSIEELIADQEARRIMIDAALNASPDPYERLMEAIDIHKSNGPILVLVQDERLVISASPENLDVLSSYFEFSDDEDEGAHNHFEYFDGDMYVHPRSRSFVVMLGANE